FEPPSRNRDLSVQLGHLGLNCGHQRRLFKAARGKPLQPRQKQANCKKQQCSKEKTDRGIDDRVTHERAPGSAASFAALTRAERIAHTSYQHSVLFCKKEECATGTRLRFRHARSYSLIVLAGGDCRAFGDRERRCVTAASSPD